MPEISRTIAPGAGAKPVTPDPARARKSIRPLSQTAVSAGVSILIHGEPGVGKTTLVKTLPRDGTLLIDVEGGSDVLGGYDVDTFSLEQDLRNLPDLIAFIGALTSEEYRFVAIDSVTNLEKRMLDTMKVVRGKEYATLGEYGDLGEKCSEYHRRITDLRWRGVNVLVIAHSTKAMRGEDGVVNPLLQPKTAKHLLGLVSAVGHLAADHEGARSIQWAKTDTVQAKTRYDCLAPLEAVPKDSRTYLGDVFRRIYAERKAKFTGETAGAAPAAKPTPQVAAAEKAVAK